MDARIEDMFNGLLFGLPPGMLWGSVWLAYSVWMRLSNRRFLTASA